MEDKKEKKATYDELNNYCAQLFEQNKKLQEQVKQLNMANMFRRLDYLFAVVSNKDAFDKDFIAKCVAEIQQALTIPEVKNDKESVKEEKKGE